MLRYISVNTFLPTKYLPAFIQLAVFYLYGCEIINKEEPIPSYIYIEKFSVSSNITTQGYPSEKITDAWVYANNNFIGVFELPAKIPVIALGETEFLIYAGIKENGISGTGVIYPFYNSYLLTQNLSEENIDSIFPSTTYKPDLNYIFMERFEIGNQFQETSDSEGTMAFTNDSSNVFEGLQSLQITIPDTFEYFRCENDSPLLFPTAGNDIFLEIDYKCDIEFSIWITGTSATYGSLSSYIITVTPKTSWNKIYINLALQLQFFAQYQIDSYRLEVRATKSASDTAANVFLDNIKIISY